MAQVWASPWAIAPPMCFWCCLLGPKGCQGAEKCSLGLVCVVAKSAPGPPFAGPWPSCLGATAPMALACAPPWPIAPPMGFWPHLLADSGCHGAEKWGLGLIFVVEKTAIGAPFLGLRATHRGAAAPMAQVWAAPWPTAPPMCFWCHLLGPKGCQGAQKRSLGLVCVVEKSAPGAPFAGL